MYRARVMPLAQPAVRVRIREVRRRRERDVREAAEGPVDGRGHEVGDELDAERGGGVVRPGA